MSSIIASHQLSSSYQQLQTWLQDLGTVQDLLSFLSIVTQSIRVLEQVYDTVRNQKQRGGGGGGNSFSSQRMANVILMEIFSFLPLKMARGSQRTCRRWFLICHSMPHNKRYCGWKFLSTIASNLLQLWSPSYYKRDRSLFFIHRDSYSSSESNKSLSRITLPIQEEGGRGFGGFGTETVEVVKWSPATTTARIGSSTEWRPNWLEIVEDLMYVVHDKSVTVLNLVSQQTVGQWFLPVTRESPDDLGLYSILKVDPNQNRVYVTLSGIHQILVYNLQGHEIQRLGKGDKGHERNNSGAFFKPRGICLDQKNLYVCDRATTLIQVLSKPDGEFIRQFGKSRLEKGGTLEHPQYLYLLDDLLYICDDYRLQIYTVMGEFVSYVGLCAKIRKDGCFAPKEFGHASGVCRVGGKLYVSEYSKYRNGRIHVFV